MGPSCRTSTLIWENRSLQSSPTQAIREPENLTFYILHTISAKQQVILTYGKKKKRNEPLHELYATPGRHRSMISPLFVNWRHPRAWQYSVGGQDDDGQKRKRARHLSDRQQLTIGTHNRSGISVPGHRPPRRRWQSRGRERGLIILRRLSLTSTPPRPRP